MTTSRILRICGRRFLLAGALVLVAAVLLQTLGVHGLSWAGTARASDALLAGLAGVLLTTAMALFNAYTGATALLAGIVLMSVASTIAREETSAPGAVTQADGLI